MSCLAIPHSQQRYETVGDWQIITNYISIHVSKMSDPRYEQLVALHEVVECLLCKWTGVSEQAVDDFDHSFTASAEGAEPGDDPKAPYHQQHVIASAVEHLAADLLGVDWDAYSKEIESL